MSHQKQPRTPGGQRLRALRESCGKTQLDVELDANLGIGYLQRLELGKVQQPDPDTLNRILDVFGVNFAERCDVLAQFGYTAPMSVPNDAETQWAINIFHTELNHTTMPAYLLDCSHRLLAWNAPIPQLFGGQQTLCNARLLPPLIFDAVNGIADLILNADTFYAAQIRIIRYENQRCRNQAVYQTFIDQMRAYPNFLKYWSHNAADPSSVPIRPLVPLKLDTGHSVAHFRLIAETFAGDPRFRVIYYMPDDAATLRQCLTWHTDLHT